MMGTLALVVDGTMCCCVHDDALMVRVGPDTREDALAEPHVTAVNMRGRQMRSFVLVGAAGIATDAALKQWINRAIDSGATSRSARAR